MKWYSAVAIAVVVVLVAVYVINNVVFSYPEVEEKVVEYGDIVGIYFVAYVKIGNYRYAVDSNMKEVVEDDNAWPKAPNFIRRNTSAPFTDTIGSGDLPLALELGLIGHRENETVFLKLTPEEARRASKAPDAIVVSPRDVQIPVLQEVSRYYFTSLFGEPPAIGKEYTHPVYGWRVRVLPGGGDMVILYHMPQEDEYFPSPGWRVEIVARNETTILVHLDAEVGAMSPEGWVVVKVTGNDIYFDKQPGFGRDVYYIVEIVQVSKE